MVGVLAAGLLPLPVAAFAQATPEAEKTAAPNATEVRKAVQRVRASGEGPPYLRFNPADVHVQHFDGTAVVTFHLGQFPAPTEKEPSTFSRRTVVLRQIGGKWLIVHLHASNMVSAPTEHRPPKGAKTRLTSRRNRGQSSGSRVAVLCAELDSVVGLRGTAIDATARPSSIKSACSRITPPGAFAQ